MKKYFLAALFLLTFIFGVNSARAFTIADVTAEHWAADDIVKCLENNYISATPEGKFLPEESISRLDFALGLLRVLQSDYIKVTTKSVFKDVNDNTKNQEEIRALEQLRIIYGYPDKTFRAQTFATRSEAASAIGNITKSHDIDMSTLDRFYDKNKVPNWVARLWAKDIENGLYINHPDENILRPNDYLTRAEAAVLLVKISNRLELIEARYRPQKEIKEALLREEQLNVYSKAPRNTVSIYNSRNSVEAGNVIEVRFDRNFNSKDPNVQTGNDVNFILVNDLYTEDKTLILPNHTIVNARVVRMQPTVWRNKNYKALVVADKITLPDGNIIQMAGVPLTKKTPFINRNTLIKPNGKKTFGEKTAEYFGKGDKKELTRAEFLVRYAEKLSPMVRYKVKAGKPLYLLLTGDMNIPAEN